MASERSATQKNVINHDGEMTLSGILLALVALLGLLNQGDPNHLPVGSFIAYCFICFFGIFYFIALLYLFFVAFYLIFKKKAFVVHYDLVLLGILLIFLSVLIASSTPTVASGLENITLQNFLEYFQNQIGTLDLLPVEITSTTTNLGGGIIGFFFAGLLNSTITPLGTQIVIGVFMGLGIILCFEKLIRRFFRYLKERSRAAKEEKQTYQAARALPDDIEEKPQPVITEEHRQAAPVQYTFYSRPATPSSGLTKAVFSRGSGSSAPLTSSQPTVAMSMTPRPATLPGYSANPAPAPTPMPTKVIPAAKPIPQPVVETKAEVEEEPIEPSFVASQAPSTPPKPDFSNSAAFAPTVFTPPKPIEPVIEKPAAPKKVAPAPNPYANYVYPPLNLLSDYETAKDDARNDEVSIQRMAVINKAFEDLGVGAMITSYKVGPSVTRFDVQPDKDVQVVNVAKVITDLSMRLGGIPARFEALVRGKSTSGLEIQNAVPTTVGFKEVLTALEKQDPTKKGRLTIAFGKDISGDVLSTSVKDFPHLLVAGTTGSGKSIFMHSMIMTLIMRNTPEELRLIIIDPKRVEMSKYREMPHLLCPIITEYDKAKVAMDRLVAEMENRYTLFEETYVSDVYQYNDAAKENGREKLPTILVVVDEYADLVEGCKEIATPVVRVAQKARAAGIHLIISTQRPSVNVITGVIKANLPTRVALSVASTTDSLTILGEGGAEKLLGNGDMLVDCAKISRSGFTRVQGCFVDNKEIKRVVDFIKERYPLVYKPEFLDLTDHTAAGPTYNPADGLRTVKFEDDMYEQVKSIIMTRDATSISSIQREFGFGFPRAGKIFAQLQADGIVAKTVENGATAKGCKVLMRAPSSEETEQPEPVAAPKPPTPDFGGH